MKTVWSSVIVVAGLAAALLGQQLGPRPPARVSGSVLGPAGRPLQGANVTLRPVRGGLIPPIPGFQPPGTIAATTNAEGAFQMDGILPGNYALYAERSGYLAQGYGARTPADPGRILILGAGQVLTGLQVQLERQGVIAGRILDAFGEPRQGIQVRAARITYSNGQRRVEAVGNDTTDDRGAYRIAGLVTGRYYVAAEPGSPAQTVEEVEIRTYYPGSTDLSAAVPIDVSAGIERPGVDFVMRRTTVHSISGAVSKRTSGSSRANLLLAGRDGLFALSLTQSGMFTFRLPTGAYTLYGSSGMTGRMQANIPFANNGAMMKLAALEVQTAGTQQLARSGQKPEPTSYGQVSLMLGNQDADGIVLSLEQGSTVTGTVRTSEGDFSALSSQVKVTLATPMDRDIVWTFSTDVSVSGTFEIEGVVPGRYGVMLEGLPRQENLYIKSVRLGGQDATRTGLNIAAGTGGHMEIVLSRGAAALTGIVRDDSDQPLPGVDVTLWPRTPTTGRPDLGIRTMKTDESGVFSLGGLRPNDYYVAAWERLPQSGLAQYPEFLNRFRSQASRLELSESASSSIQLKPVDTGRIAEVVSELR